MIVYATVEIFQDVLNDVKVFLSEESACKAEQQWLERHSINDDAARECEAQNGTEFQVHECELKP